MRLMGLRDFHIGTLPADSKGRKRKATFSPISGHQFLRNLEKSVIIPPFSFPFKRLALIAAYFLLQSHVPF